MNFRMYGKLYIGLVICTALLVVISCAINPVTGKREFMLLTEADEIALGQQTDAEVSQMYGVYDNPQLTAYINAMGQKMVAQSHRPNLAFSFKVLDTPVVNAFAVPGGYIYFTRGILAYLNDEAQFAGVMGHEMGHVTARHSAKQYSQATVAQIGLGVGMEISKEFQKYAGIAQLGMSLLFLRFSRDNEREADALGVEYSSKSGYDATHMADFFVTLERLNPGSDQSGLPGWFSTHPNPPNRIAAVQRDAGVWKSKLPQQSFAVKRDEFIQKLDGIVYGEDPQQGYVEGNIFYHPMLKFQFPVPAQWEINNTPSQVQIFTKAQDAAILFSLAAESNPSDAANKFILDTNATVKDSKNVSVNGLPARRVVSDIASEQAVITVMSYFIQKEGRIYVFHGFTNNTTFSQYAGTFEGTMGQFKTLTDPNKINVKPALLSVKKTTQAGTLRKILQDYGVAQDKLQEFAILNGKNLDDTVPANTLIKVVVKQ